MAKPGRQLANRQASDRIAPVRGNGGGGAQNEIALTEQRMGDGKTFRGEDAATPQHDIEVERAGAPSLPAPLPAERLLDRLQVGESFFRGLISFYECSGIGIAALGWPDGGGMDGRRYRCDCPPLGRESFEGCCNDRGRRHSSSPYVGAERDQVGVGRRRPAFAPRQMSSQIRP